MQQSESDPLLRHNWSWGSFGTGASTNSISNGVGQSPIITRPRSSSKTFSFRGINENLSTGIEDSPGNFSFRSLASSSRSLSFRGGGGTSSGVVSNANTGIPVELWIIPATCCALSYALYNISIKKASNGINPILGGVILQAVAALSGLMIYIGERSLKSESDELELETTSSGLVWSVAAGIFVGLAEILSFLVNGKGVPATQSIPVIVGGSVFFGTVLGRLFLGEELSIRGWLGVSLITFGIGLVSMEE